jgi:HAD superfamily hydrolase (TIGR01456 family)
MDKHLRVPAIITDVDGVLVRGPYAITNAEKAMKYIRQPLNTIDSKRFECVRDQLPFVCVTNLGGVLEDYKAESINEILKLSTQEEKLLGAQVVVNHSAMRTVMKDYADKIILIGGIGNIQGVAESCQLKQYITIDEFCTLFPSIVPLSERTSDAAIKLRPVIKERLKISDDAIFNEPFQIGAVVVFNDIIKWDEASQVMCDLLTTTDGTIAKSYNLRENLDNVEHIPIFVCTNDLLYKDEFKLSRFGCGAYVKCFEALCKSVLGFHPKITFYGKPEVTTFKYTEQLVKERWNNFEISNYYMIGDNPETDIKGANNVNWISILVRTGVFKGKENDEINPAKYVVDDFMEAVKLICRLEEINCNF